MSTPNFDAENEGWDRNLHVKVVCVNRAIENVLQIMSHITAKSFLIEKTATRRTVQAVINSMAAQGGEVRKERGGDRWR